MPKNIDLATIPNKAIRLNQLAIREGEHAPSSGHIVTKVDFIKQSGLEGLGFLKLCDPTYPPFLAKMVVAISVELRFSLGIRASEERLVYDSNNQIVGTVSVALKNFVPMQSTSDSNSNDPEKNKLSDPDTRTLIDVNIAEILIALWRRKQDDLHPGNLSTAGCLDYDMCLYHILSIIKVERLSCGRLQSSPALGTTLREEDLHEFPLLQSTRTHWPTQQPLNLNYRKAYKAQDSFCRLKDCAMFRNQMFTAILKELLSFQKSSLKARLASQLGNETIDLDSLKDKPSSSKNEKKEQLIAILGHDTFYKDVEFSQEHSFVDFYTKVANKEYLSFYKCAVHYKEFRNFLIAHPNAYNEVREFFIEENKKYSVEEQIDLDILDQAYQQIWRDASVKKVIHSLKKITDQFNKIKLDICSEEFFTITTLDFETNSESSDSDSEYLEHIPNINSDELQIDNDTELKKIRNEIANLHSNLSEYCRNYFETEDTNSESNNIFITNCSQKLNEAKQNIHEILNPLELPSSKIHKHHGCNTLISNWLTMLSQINYQTHLTMRENTKDQPRVKYIASQISSHKQSSSEMLDSDINTVLKDALVDWLSKQKLSDTIVDINVALNEYAPKVSTGPWSYLNLFAYTRQREPTVKKLLAKVIKEPTKNSIELIIDIFLEQNSGWNEQSLNSIIMKRLLNKMLQDYTSDFDNAINYASLAKFKDAKTRENFDFQKHILKVKDTFIDSIITHQVNKPHSVIAL